MGRFTTPQDRHKAAARELRNREGEIDSYDANLANFARAIVAIDRDYPDGWGSVPPTSVEDAPLQHKERAAAMAFREQLERFTSDTIRERTKVKYYQVAIEEELVVAGVDPVALLASEPTPEP